MKKLSVLIGILLISFKSFTQKIEKVNLHKEDLKMTGEVKYFSNGKPEDLYYIKVVPEKNVKGLIILLGGGDLPETLTKELKLPRLAAKEGYLTVIPFITTMYLQEPLVKYMDKIISDLLKRYKMPADKIAIGGFSGGGTIALRYTEYANETKATAAIPKVVFGIDPPIDFHEFFYSCNGEIKRNCPASDWGVNECRQVQADMLKRFGTPEEFPDNYIRVSPFSVKAEDGGNSKWLKNTVVRLYTEPDINWQMENRCRSYYDLNAAPLSAMINTLRMQGNKKAELIVTIGKGYRFDGMRHPHSWSIMDENEALNWIITNLN